MNKNIKYLVESFLDDEDETIDIDINFDSRDKFIDLGLPSGTLWARCNIGANSPEECGLYFQWASLEGHKPETFDFCHTDYIQKYNYEEYNGVICSTLRPEDDIAIKEYNGIAKIPSDQLILELVKHCKYEWAELNGVRCGKFTGPNNNFMYIPISGECTGTSIRGRLYHGNIWSSTLNIDDPTQAFLMFCGRQSASYCYSYRNMGMPIRPVYNK